MKKIYLIDGTAVLYRSYFAFINRPLINSKGENTSAIYGTINSIIKLIDTFEPEYLAVSFDLKAPTFRHKITSTYKANRPPMPEDLVSQIEPVKKFYELAGIPEFSVSGYEADDVLATLAETFKDEFEVVIVSGDKDFAQLVDERVTLFDPAKEKFTDQQKVVEKYGITAEQFIDYLAIVGDSADNIPGVKGIGPKGASALLKEFGTLEEIYDNLENIKQGSRKKLEASKEESFLSQTLAKIIKDVPIDNLNIKRLVFDTGNMMNVTNLTSRYELTRLDKRLHEKYGSFKTDFFDMLDQPTEEKVVVEETGNSVNFTHHLITKEDDFATLTKKIKEHDVIAIDTETTSTDPMRAEIVGISIAFDDEDAYYISLAHRLAENLDAEKVIAELNEILKGRTIVGHNIKYDLIVMEKYGFDSNLDFFDTMIASYLTEPQHMRHSLDYCAESILNYKMLPITELIGKGKSQITFDLVPQDKASFYAAEDAYVTYMIYKPLKELMVDTDLFDLFTDIEIPLLKTLKTIETTGVFLDKEFLRKLSSEVKSRINELTSEIYFITGQIFNINSTKQLGSILFESMQLPVIKKTKTGYSTDMSVLEALSVDYPIAEKLIEYRMLTKLESTYISALPQLINPTTNRIHSSFNQTVASTGRLSSSNPNLQNIPIRSEVGKKIRQAFTAHDDDHILVAADYSQIELRLFAIMSQNEDLCTSFREKIDIHSRTASLIFDKPIEEVTSDDRRRSKVINFGIMYGMGSVSLSRELKISRKEAKQFIDNYFAAFPTILEFIDNLKQKARSKGYAETMFGRKLYLSEMFEGNKRTQADAERVAVNMPIQGSAADLIKIAMNRIQEKIENNPDINMLIQVHDELVFEVKKDCLEEAKNLIQTTMEDVLPEKYKGIIPLLVDVGTGQNWLEAH
jgi:DNA polymerase-1